MYNQEQSHNPVYLRLETIDKAVDLLKQAFTQQQSIELVVTPEPTTEPEPEVYINSIESARRQVDVARGDSATILTNEYAAPTDTVVKPNHIEVPSADVNLEELFKAANKVNR